MPPSGMRSKVMTQADVERLAGDGKNMVMKAVHDHVFEPWSTEAVERCVSELRGLTLELQDEATIVDAVLERDEVKRFVFQHETLGKKLMNVEFCRDDRAVAALTNILAVRSAMMRGALSEDDARSAVAEIALKAALPANGIPPRP